MNRLHWILIERVLLLEGRNLLCKYVLKSIHVVTKRSLYPDNVPDIAPREDSGGPRSHCVGGQYLTPYVSL